MYSVLYLEKFPKAETTQRLGTLHRLSTTTTIYVHHGAMARLFFSVNSYNSPIPLLGTKYIKIEICDMNGELALEKSPVSIDATYDGIFSLELTPPEIQMLTSRFYYLIIYYKDESERWNRMDTPNGRANYTLEII